MKTETRSRIVEIIKKEGAIRPIELVRRLAISPQAIHRHLKSLVAAGQLEARGRGPMTRYVIAGIPDLRKARDWCNALSKPAESPSEWVCETRDVFAARLGRLSSCAKMGVSEEELALLISVAGEVGNNTFDHNLGHWRDIPGCWFETQVTGKRLWLCIADRGQGVFRSLSRADPTIHDEQTALVAAFERTISGRAPESRGNGLKFVKNIILQDDRRGLACRSGDGLVDYGQFGADGRKELSVFSSKPGGTITLIVWSLK